ncbi:LamG-like jellyroll fold domain-containing protein [Rubripirellula reticaptiva]
MSIDDDFIDRVLADDVSEEEAAEFQQWLKIPANLQRFALRGELHSQLRRSLQRRHIQSSALGTKEDVSAPPEPRSTVVRSRKMLLLSVAGLVTAACILIALVGLRHEGNGAPNHGDTVAATIVSNVSGLLIRGDRQWDGTYLSAGEYELQKGLLHLQFGGGVMVYVEAPARFDAVGDSRVVLHNGRLSARVPPEGIGFTVETPEAEVVDFGTEFSVDVEGGASEVHVFDGLVRVNPGASSQRDESRSVDVQASHAVRITDGAANPENISIATDRFIRNFEEPRLNYARAIKQLSPLAYYRMPIRDRGLVAQPPEYSGVVLTGQGKRPPHACGVFVGGSLRVGVDSIGRGGRVDTPPALSTGQFSLTVFVYLEDQAQHGVVATNFDGERGNFDLSLDETGLLQASIRNSNGDVFVVAGNATLPLAAWRHVVVTADGENLQLYEDGKFVASKPCKALATTDAETVWFGTDASAGRVWNGRIDEVALFDRALTEEEVAALYRTAQEEIARTL